MKKCISILFCFFFLLFTSYALATNGTTTLSTYYPPPTAAYNKVSLSLASTYTVNTYANASAYCNGNNNGVTYYDTSHGGILYECTGKDTSIAANGTVHADNNGTLYVVMNGKNIVYPQECFNKFCSYAYPSSNNPCINSSGEASFTCPLGFTQQTPIDADGDNYVTFYTNKSSVVVSIVCCSGYINNYVPPTASVSSLAITAVSAEVPNFPLNNSDFTPSITQWSTNPVITDPLGNKFYPTGFPTFSFSPAGGTLNSGKYFVSLGIGGEMFYYYPTIPPGSSGTISLNMPIDLAALPTEYGATCTSNGGCGSGNCVNGACGLSTCSGNGIMCNATCCQSGTNCCNDGCCSSSCDENGNCSSGGSSGSGSSGSSPTGSGPSGSGSG